MPSFSDELTRLNQDQRRAVDAVEGPVMVVAGPGTGKTQVLAMRVANILKKTHARPSNILCLTFSTAGATAMRERLRSLIGADAYGVTVSTVHGFCDGLIRRYAPAFSDWSLKKPLSDLERTKTLMAIADELAPTSALINPKDPYERISGIASRISECKREGKSLQDVARVADLYESEMAEKSRKGTKAHDKNMLMARKFRDFAEIYAKYEAALQESGSYDFDDMILTVLKVLGEEDWLLQSLQERYQYFLVDEAQDLNGAQWKVIERLTTYVNVPNDPNFFLVGDDDQSIYRFQGANLEHMLQFKDRFPKASVVVLTENYRSVQPILDAAGRLIARNDERLIGKIPGLSKDLKAHTKEEGSKPVLLRPPSDTAELWLIADLCEERIKKGTPPEEIAILVQTNQELFPIYDVLRARELPVILHGKADLLQHPIVTQALSILRSVQSESDNLFQHALSCDAFGCHPADISRVIHVSRERKKTFQAMLLDLERADDLSLADREALIAARDTLLSLHLQRDSRTVLETVEHVLRESNLTPGGKDADPLDVAAIEAFFHYVKQYCLEHPAVTLAQFMRDLELYADEGFRELRLSYRLPHLVTSGIQLLTAHQSKGLEFSTVILSQFREGHWDERRNPSRLSVPEELLFGWESEQKRYEKHQDERRVAYVAFTRAKRELFLLCPKEFSVGERARPVAPSAFFAEAGPLPERDASLREPEHASVLLLHPVRQPDEELRAYLLHCLQSFSLSPSSLSTFLRDPEEFKRLHLLHLPDALTPESLMALGYGSAVHWALREWAIASQKGVLLPLEKFLEAFERSIRSSNVLTPPQVKNLLAVGNQSLPVYFEQHLSGAKPVLYAAEREYRAMLGDIPIKGKIDRIDLASPDSADAIIIDYKTGRPKPPSAIRGGMEPGSVSRTEEGDYFRQLVFYALLLEHAEPLLVPQAFCIEFIGEREEGPIARKFEVTDAEKESLRSLIRDVWKKVQKLDFTPL